MHVDPQPRDAHAFFRAILIVSLYLNTRFSISFSAVIIEKCIYMSPPGVRWITAEDGYRGSAVVGIIPRFIPVSSHLAGFVETNVSLASARLIAS